MIINTTGCVDEYLIHLSELGMPIVLADRSIHEKYLIDTITTNNYDATYECVKFLHEQGYHKVAFFTEKIGDISSRYVRHNGYLDAVGKIYNVNGNDYTYLVDSNDGSVCRENLHKFIDQNPDEPVAIFTVNGVTLLNVLQSMKDEGYELGYKIGICGFDDWGWAQLIPPGITTLTQDSYMAGRKCAELLLKKIEQNDRSTEAKYVEMPAHLSVRGSTTININKMNEGSNNENEKK
jgi:LacI family transcriptional regulator, kdg operon repressor